MTEETIIEIIRPPQSEKGIVWEIIVVFIRYLGTNGKARAAETIHEEMVMIQEVKEAGVMKEILRGKTRVSVQPWYLGG
jgi:hypothetical protein